VRLPYDMDEPRTNTVLTQLLKQNIYLADHFRTLQVRSVYEKYCNYIHRTLYYITTVINRVIALLVIIISHKILSATGMHYFSQRRELLIRIHWAFCFLMRYTGRRRTRPCLHCDDTPMILSGLVYARLAPRECTFLRCWTGLIDQENRVDSLSDVVVRSKETKSQQIPIRCPWAFLFCCALTCFWTLVAGVSIHAFMVFINFYVYICSPQFPFNRCGQHFGVSQIYYGVLPTTVHEAEVVDLKPAKSTIHDPPVG
jgi:hypothetical protein